MRINYCICEECGAHLDFGERCDCQSKKEAAPQSRERPHAKKPISSLSANCPKVKRIYGMEGKNAQRPS